MNPLSPYFDHIGYRGDARADFATLRSLLQAHVTSVPFENLNVQLGRRLTTSPEDAFEKIVNGGRGGWCYEQNGLFGWILERIGYDVTRVAAAVMRHERGDVALANHLCLLVRCEDSPETYLVDVGFGGSLWEPILLAAAEHEQQPYRLGLRELPAGEWRFFEDHGGGEFCYDFAPVAAGEPELAAKCDELQTDPDSSFVLNLVAQIRKPDRHVALRGRVLSNTTAAGVSSRNLESPRELLQVLEREFGLDVPEIADLWPRIIARHREVFGPDA